MIGKLFQTKKNYNYLNTEPNNAWPKIIITDKLNYGPNHLESLFLFHPKSRVSAVRWADVSQFQFSSAVAFACCIVTGDRVVNLVK